MSKYISLVFLILVLSVLLVLPVSAAEGVCDGCSYGLFNGTPACLSGDQLHLCQNNFPDENFRAALQIWDNDQNGALNAYDEARMPYIDCSGRGVCSLEGIAYFVELQHLTCENNALTHLDISKNTKLESLSLEYNQLVSLDISNAPNLVTLLCVGNQLTQLDISNNPMLDLLTCGSNMLTSLDVSTAPHLRILYCEDNRLRELDVSQNPELELLSCRNNHLTSLDLSKNSKLEGLSITDQSFPEPIVLDTGNEPLCADLSQYLSADALANISRVFWQHGEIPIDIETGLVSLPYYNIEITYQYSVPYDPSIFKTPDEGIALYIIPELSVRLTVLCDHEYESPSCPVCPPVQEDLPVDDPHTITVPYTVWKARPYKERVAGSEDELRQAMLTEEERERIENGETILLDVAVTDITDSAPESDKISFAKEIKGGTVIAYFDLALTKHIGSDPPLRFYKGAIPLFFTIQLPDEIAKYIELGEFQVYSISDGDVTPAYTTCRDDYLLFCTKDYSTLALVFYSDDAPADESTPQESAVTDPPSETNPVSAKEPKNSIPTYVLCTVCCFILFSVLILIFFAKRKNKTA